MSLVEQVRLFAERWREAAREQAKVAASEATLTLPPASEDERARAEYAAASLARRRMMTRRAQ